MSRLRRTWAKITGSDILTGLVALVLVVAVAAGVTYFYTSPPGRQTVTFTTRDAVTLNGGEDVRVSGISIGKVAAVHLRANDVEVELDIEDDVRIGDRTTARVQLLTAVGGFFVSLIPAGRVTDSSSTIRPERVTVPYTIADTIQELPRVTDDVEGVPIEKTLAQVSEGIGSNTESIRNLVSGLHTLSNIVDKQKGQLESIMAMTSNYTTTFERSREFVFELIRKVNVALSQYHTYRAGFSEAYRQLGGVLERLGVISQFYLNHSDQIYPAVSSARALVLRMRDGMTAMIDNLGPLQQRLTGLVAPEGARGTGQFVLDATSMCLPVPGRSC